MAAIDMGFRTIIEKEKHENINIIYSWELYHETPKLIQYYAEQSNVSACEIVIDSSEHDIDRVINLFSSDHIRNKINILFIESYSNVSGYCLDLSIISKLRELSCKLYIIMDNTWLTHAIFNPFAHDIDIVVTSLSKYYSSGSHIAGAILFKDNELYEISRNIHELHGYHISPETCEAITYMINRGYKDTSGMARQIAEYLLKFRSISEVWYPLFETHPSYRLKDVYFPNNKGPSVFSFKIKKTKKEIIEKVGRCLCRPIKFKASYGGTDTRLSPDMKEINGETWCRISIGSEERFEDITENLLKIL